MKLPREFIQLPYAFNAERLKSEVESLPAEAWCPHPAGFKGNWAVPLISVDGGINDYFAGPMKQTPWLERMPYVRQVLSSFEVVFGRSRLMALDAGAQVKAHSDANYHWFTRARIHIPIVTLPEVEFHCGDKKLHMAEGQAWIFDNWKKHAVFNRSRRRRIHLVADTLGSAQFWSMVDRCLEQLEAGAEVETRQVVYVPGQSPDVRGEKYNTPDVVAPSELKELCEDLLADLSSDVSLNPPDQVKAFTLIVKSFYRDWAMFWTLQSNEQSGWGDYENLRNRVLQEMHKLNQPLVLPSTGLIAQQVLFARVLVACVRRPMPGVKTLQFAE